MCHPAIVAAVSIAGSLAGGAIQAKGAREQAEARARAEERRAELADRQKEVNQTQGSFDRKRQLEEHQKIMGFNQAAGAERGLSYSGSLTDVADDNAREAAHSIEAIRYRVDGQRDNLTFEANSARERKQSHLRAGKLNALSAWVKAGTGAATTLGNAVYASMTG